VQIACEEPTSIRSLHKVLLSVFVYLFRVQLTLKELISTFFSTPRRLCLQLLSLHLIPLLSIKPFSSSSSHSYARFATLALHTLLCFETIANANPTHPFALSNNEIPINYFGDGVMEKLLCHKVYRIEIVDK
jgi:hypothetical protein